MGYPRTSSKVPCLSVGSSIRNRSCDVRLDIEMARRNDSLAHPPQTNAPVIAIVGGDEPEGFHVLSQEYVETCRKAGLEAEYFSVPGFHHFSVIEEVFRAGSAHFDRMLDQFR